MRSGSGCGGCCPLHPPRGGRWADHRKVIDGILFRTRTGCPWRDVPEGFGHWKTVYNRHRRWSGGMAPGPRSWASCGLAVMKPTAQLGGQRRFHRRPRPPARRRRPAAAGRGLGHGGHQRMTRTHAGQAGREALGRSRGGLSTKIHLVADRRCRPLTRITTPGQRGDCPQFIPLMNQLAVGRRGKGRPRTRPAAAMGDKAYSSAANRAYLRKRGIKAVIPVKEDQKSHRHNRGSHGGRPPPSTVDGTKNATPSNAASASSSSSARSPHAMTNASSCTRAPWIWRPSRSGYETQSHDPRDTP